MIAGSKKTIGHNRSVAKNPKSPRARFHMKMEAEKNERKDKSRIKDPHTSVKDLFHK